MIKYLISDYIILIIKMFSLNVLKKGGNSFITQSKKYFGKNEKAIKMRIKSISSIEKITRAMKMVRQT